MQPIIDSLEVSDALNDIIAKLSAVAEFCDLLSTRDGRAKKSLVGMSLLVDNCISDLDTISETAKKF